MEKLQFLLTGGKGTATDLTVHLSAAEESLFVFLGMALLERVRNDPEALVYKMLVGRLANSGMALRELERAFRHDHRTLKRWGEALKSDDSQFMVRAFAGQGALPKVTEQMVAFVQGRYAELKGTVRDYRQKIAEEVRRCFGEDLSRETLRRLFASGTGSGAAGEPVAVSGTMVEPAAGAASAPAPEVALPAWTPDAPRAEGVRAPGLPCGPVTSGEAPEPIDARPRGDGTHAAAETGDQDVVRENGCPTASVPSLTFASTDNHSPSPVRAGPPAIGGSGRLGMPFSGQPVGATPRVVHHAGQVLFAPWMDVVGFDRDRERAFQAQWLGQVLQGAVNIEPSKGVSAPDLSLFVGPVVAGLDTQRRELHRTAGAEAVLAALRTNARLVREGPGEGRYFYYDTHSKEYTGEVPILKGWCGRRHAIRKVLHLDLIHTRLGDPCFVQHFDNFYDLRERFFIALHRFDQLFAAPLRQGRTFILDRGIYGVDTVRLFMERGDGLITWEKGYTGGEWDPVLPYVEFLRTRSRNRADDLREGTHGLPPSHRPQRLPPACRDLPAPLRQPPRRPFLLRGLTRASGVVRRRGDTIEILLWPKGQFEPAQLRVVQTFLDQMSTFINGHFRGRASPVRIGLLDSGKLS